VKIGAVEIALLEEIARRGIADADSYDYRPTPGTLLAIATLAKAGLDAPGTAGGRFVERANGSIVSRTSDYDPSGGIRLARTDGGDVTVTTVGEVIFAGPGGGGRSTNTRLALLALFTAMEADAAASTQPPPLLAAAGHVPVESAGQGG
jgi:hypothetical protein